jgi:hypothetical protein
MSQTVNAAPIVTPDRSPAPFSGVWGVSLLFTPITGGVMAAINWARLGKPSRGVQSLLTGIVGFLVAEAVNIGLQFSLGALLALVGVFVVNFIFGGILAQMQRAEYQQWVVAHGGKQPSLQHSGCLVGLGIVVVSSAVALGLNLLIQPVAIKVLSQAQPATTFTDASVTLTKPSGWFNVDLAKVSGTLCTQAGSQCLLAGIHGDDLQFVFNRFSSSAFSTLTPQDIDSQLWASLQQNTPSAKEVSNQALKVDGRDADQRIYTFTDATGNQARLLLFIKEDSGTVLRLDVSGSPTAFSQSQHDIDALISGIHFATPKT